MFQALLLALLATGTPQDAVPSQPVYAELPLRNLCGDREAAELFSQRLRAALQARGARFIEASRVEELLVENRIRYTDSLSVEQARMLQARTGARHVIAGVLLDFARGTSPRAAIGLRVLDAQTGGREQSVVVSLRGEDSRGWLGLGAIEDPDELVERCVERLLCAFGPAGEPLAEPAHDPLVRLDIEDERPPALPRFDLAANRGRLAVMPFVNRSSRPEAGVQFGEILANEWFHEQGVEVIEASEVRAAMVREKIRYMHDLDLVALAAIARAAGVRYFALGSVEQYGEEEQTLDGRFPVVEATVRLLDAQSGLVVASAAIRCRGDERRQPLGFGLVRDPIALAQTTARKLIQKLGR